MKYFKKIIGDKIYLSPINKNDIEMYTKWVNDAGVSDNIGLTAQLIDIDTETKLLEELANGGYNFAIIRKEDDALLGNVGFMFIKQIYRCAECGILIGEPENRGKGYGSEALRLLLQYGFNTLNLNNIMLRVFNFNKQAIACYEKLGFKRIGARRQAYFLNGGYHDEIYMDILPEDLIKR